MTALRVHISKSLEPDHLNTSLVCCSTCVFAHVHARDLRALLLACFVSQQQRLQRQLQLQLQLQLQQQQQQQQQ